MDLTSGGAQGLQCSVVIRAFNEAAHTGRLSEAIRQQNGVRAEVIVVDFGSTDGMVDLAMQHGAHILYIPSAELTFGRSLNLGVQATSHEYVVLTSAHLYPLYPDWIECLLHPLEDPSVAVVYGEQRVAAGSDFSERQIFKT